MTEKIFPYVRSLLAASAVVILSFPGGLAGGLDPIGPQSARDALTSPSAMASPDRAAPAVFEATRVDRPIRVDGVLENDEWAGVPTLPLPWEVNPGDNAPASVETFCRIAFDADKLYLGCEATDPEPSSVRAWVTDRDGIAGHDRIELILDPFRDSRRGVAFGISAQGVQSDALFNQQGSGSQGGGARHDATWDAIWNSAGRITTSGYVVEAAIPFRSLRFPEDGGDRPWGILVSRFRPRSSMVELRSAPLDRDEACVLCQADHLTGLVGISPGTNVELSPTFTASRSDAAGERPGELEAGSVTGDPGVDLRWSPTPELAINGTVNPDFSQVEADAAQLEVNQTFALFFPEKRPFFQEGADVFQTPIRALFTRTVVDPSVGAKMTGRVASYALGAMLVRDEVNSLLLPGSQGSSSLLLDEAVTTAVGRARRDVGVSSTLGGIVVAREGGEYHNRVTGLDAFFQPRPSVTAQIQALRSWTRYPDAVADVRAGGGRVGPSTAPVGETFSGHAVQGQLRYQTRDWTLNSSAGYRGDGFRADAGFESQAGVRWGNASVERVFWGGGGRWFDRLSGQVGTWESEEIDGQLLAGGVWTGLAYTGPLQSNFTYFPNFFRQGFAGQEFGMTAHFFSAGLRPARGVGLRVSGQLGDAVDFANARKAGQVLLAPSVDLRLGRRTSLDVSHRFQRLETVDAGVEIFTAHVSEARAVYNFSNRALVRVIAQHRLTDRNPDVHEGAVPTRVRSLFTQLLFSYKVNPQTLVFLGWTDDRAGASEVAGRDLSLEPRGRAFFLKLGYAWRP